MIRARSSFAALLLLALWCVPTAHAQRLSMVTGAEPPISSSAEGDGFTERVGREMFRRIGVEIEASVTPAERALINVNAGIDDGDLMRIAGMEREYPNLVRIPEKVMDFEFVAFTLDPKTRIEGLGGLKPYAVAYATGWKFYERNVKDFADLTTVRSLGELFALLKSGRTQVALADRWQGLWAARRAGVRVFIVEPPFARLEMFVYLNKRHAALVPRAAKALADMKADGTYARIVNATLRPLERQ